MLTGPPGFGFNDDDGSRLLAGELGLPIFSVLLHGILTKFIGDEEAR